MTSGNVDFDLSICRRQRLFVNVVVTRNDVVFDAKQRRPGVDVRKCFFFVKDALAKQG
jgi:hypothetical protein